MRQAPSVRSQCVIIALKTPALPCVSYYYLLEKRNAMIITIKQQTVIPRCEPWRGEAEGEYSAVAACFFATRHAPGPLGP